MSITGNTVRDFTAHVATQRHAMAGATIVSSAALACGLGGACINISLGQLEGQDIAIVEAAYEQLASIRQRLLDLADEDGDAITTFARLRDAGQESLGQERLTEMPAEAARLALDAAGLLQAFRPFVRHVQDDLEMAITLLTGAARAATLLIDSNLRIWPTQDLLDRFEPVLTELRAEVSRLSPAARVRPALDWGRADG